MSLEQTLANARKALLAERNAQGHWEGQLSSSALSTATAMIALRCARTSGRCARTSNIERPTSNIEGGEEDLEGLVAKGRDWLVGNQNDDGGWGDTTKSYSNISTTLLCWSALSFVNGDAAAIERAGEWIRREAGSTEPSAIVKKVTARYGKDRTFAVPILMTCAIGGRLGEGKTAWKRVLPLPFEMAAFPREWYAALQLPVVSYALPALIAIGYARFFHAPPPQPLRGIRQWIWPKVSDLLTRIQPASGGFLEATPLTSFVSMALASADQVDHPVVQSGVHFLVESMREDGSWPIDTNLATWGTTLATKALVRDGSSDTLPEKEKTAIRDWILDQQWRELHPYTNAAPGGWAWTDLTGGVPDADDTPGALLALHELVPHPDEATIERAAEAVTWLLDLQNRDGGIPTFCRGWGALPFDRSSQDLTAHTLRAWHIWLPLLPPALQARVDVGTDLALAYLRRMQDKDGAWLPLWFGNQDVPGETNRLYGMAMVLLALGLLEARHPHVRPMRLRGLAWLQSIQNADGGWGGDQGAPSTIEETALAVEALASQPDSSDFQTAIGSGVDALTTATKDGTEFPASPIGFYFAKLWYFEKLYPMVWTVGALEAARRVLGK